MTRQGRPSNSLADAVTRHGDQLVVGRVVPASGQSSGVRLAPPLRSLTATLAVPQPLPTDLVSVRDGSRLTGLSDYRIRRWMWDGKISLWGRPGCLRVSLSDLMPRLAAHTHGLRPTEFPEKLRRPKG